MPPGAARQYRIPIVIDPKGATAGRVVVVRELREIGKRAAITQAAVARLSKSLTFAGAANAISNNTSAVASSLGAVAAASASTSTALTGVNRSMRDVRTASGAATAGTAAAAAGMTRMQGSASKTIPILRTLGLAVGGIGVSIGAAVAIAQIGKFEQAMASVRAVTGATAEEFENLSNLARHLGAVTTFTATQAGEAELSLARAGLTTTEILSALPSTLNLARAGGLGLAEATDIAVSSLRSFNLSATETQRVTDVMALTAARTNTTIVELSEGLKFVAPVAATLGIDIEETSASLGKLADAGFKSTLGGTGLRRVLSSLAKPTSAAKRIFSELGLTLDDLSVSTAGISGVVQKLADAGIDAGQALEIFGLRGGPAFLVLRNITEATERLERELRDAEGAAGDMAGVMDDTLLASFQRLNSAVTQSFLSFGDDGLKGALRDVSETATGVITAWNDMLPAMAATGDVTRETTDYYQRLADTLSVVGAGLYGLALTGAVVYTLKLAGAALTLLRNMNPLVLAFGAVVTAISIANSLYDTHAERVTRQVRRYANLEKSLRNIAGAANYANQTFGDLPDPTRQRLATDYERTGDEARENVGGRVLQVISSLESYFAGLPGNAFSTTTDIAQQRGTTVGAGSQQVVGRSLRATGIGGEEDVAPQALSQVFRSFVDQLRDDPAQLANRTEAFIQSIRDELEKELRSSIVSGRLKLFDERVVAGLGATEAGGGVDIQTLVGQATAADRTQRNLENPRQPEELLSKTARPLVVDELLQLERFDASRAREADLEAQVRQAGGRFGYDVRSAAGVRADLETKAQFGAFPQLEDGTIDTDTIRSSIEGYRGAESARLRQNLEIEQALPEPNVANIEALKQEIASLEGTAKTASELAGELENLRGKFREGLVTRGTTEGLNNLNEEFRNLQAGVDGIGAGEDTIDSVRELLKFAPEAQGEDKAAILAAVTEQLRAQTHPLETLVELERQQGQVATARTVAQRDELEIGLQLAELKRTNTSLTEQEIERTKEQLLLIREQNREERQRQEILTQVQQGRGQSLPQDEARQRLERIQELEQAGPENGGITGLESVQQQAATRLQGGLNTEGSQSFFDGFITGLGDIDTKASEVAASMGANFADTLGKLSDGVADSVSQSILLGKSFKDTFAGIGKQVVQEFAQSLVKLAVQQLKNYLLQLAIQSLFGGGGGAAAAAPTGTARFAEGGFVSGPGGPQSDMVPALLSDGEFVINAQATKRNRALLESINAERFQGGGLVGGGGQSGKGGVNLDIKVVNQTRAPVTIEQQRDDSSSRIVLMVKEAMEAGAFDDNLESYGVSRQPE